MKTYLQTSIRKCASAEQLVATDIFAAWLYVSLVIIGRHGGGSALEFAWDLRQTDYQLLGWSQLLAVGTFAAKWIFNAWGVRRVCEAILSTAVLLCISIVSFDKSLSFSVVPPPWIIAVYFSFRGIISAVAAYGTTTVADWQVSVKELLAFLLLAASTFASVAL